MHQIDLRSKDLLRLNPVYLYAVRLMFDLNKNEEEVLKYWNDNSIMEKVRSKNRGRKIFYFLDGPPFVSGDLHPGQMWVKSMKDVLLRYRRFRGFDVYDRAGYDVHGLPIEKRAEAQLGVKNKQEIESRIGVENFIKACKEYVEAYIGRMDKDYMRFAISLDFSNPYIPSRTPYMEIEWGYLKKIDEKGLLYTDRKSTTFCTNCGTSVSQGSMEVEYRNDTDPAIFVAFKVNEKLSKPRIERGNDLYLLIWTTTPWTIPANISVAVHPKEQYVIARIGERRYVLMKSRLDAISGLLNESAVIEKEFYGSELEGIYYTSPLEESIPKQKEYRKYHRTIMAEELVTSGEGSGLVHIAPGHGLEDYLIGKKNKLPIFSPVNMQGNYTEDAGVYRDLKVPEEANKRIIADLKEHGALVHRGDITHSYPHCWRCDTKLIFIATAQWFINIQKVKKRLLKENRKVSWHPSEAVRWQEDVLQSSPDWAISRQRYWGTPLPIWECASCNSIKVIGSLNELKENAMDSKLVDSMTDLHRPYIDNIMLKCSKCSGEMKRIKDVLDVWFDSGSAYRASLTQEQFDNLFPVDFILEGMDQLRGWFSYQLKIGTLVDGRRPFNNVVIDGMMLGEDGREMHKKLGNYISLEDLLKVTTADSFRLWCTSHIPELDLIFSKDKINEANKVIILLYNMSNLLEEYSSAIEYKPKKVKKPRSTGLSPQDAWILSRFNSTIKSATQSLDNYEIYRAVSAIKSFLIMDLSRFYLKMAKKKILDSGKKDAKSTIDLINYILYNSLILIAPITPFVSEKIYLDRFHFEESVFLNSWPKHDEKLINKEIEADFDVATDAITAILNSREKSNLKLRWPLSKATLEVNSDNARDSAQRLSNLIEDYVNVKKLEVVRVNRTNVEIKPQFQKIGPSFKENAGVVANSLKSVNSKELLGSISETGEYSLNTPKGKFTITQEHFSTVEKNENENALPFKYGMAFVDKEINKELQDEAMVREFERRIQLARKDAGLRKGDKVAVQYKVTSELAQIIERNIKKIMHDVSASSMEMVDTVNADFVKEFDLDDEKITIGMKK